MRTHSSKICRLISKKFDVDENIKNISSYRLSFFEKLVICRGLKFSLPQKVSPIDVQASFEKLYALVWITKNSQAYFEYAPNSISLMDLQL